jgi:DNA-binding MarR family transcriptional regulator
MGGTSPQRAIGINSSFHSRGAYLQSFLRLAGLASLSREGRFLMRRESTANATMPATAANGFRLEDFLPYQLAVTASRVSRLFARRYADDFGLSLPEWRVIAVVGQADGASPSAVSEMTAMDKVKVSRAVATLVARGLIKQTQDPEDGRARVLRLTRKGTTLHQGVIPVARKLEVQLSESLSRTELAALRKTLERLSEHVQAIEAAGKTR